MNREAPPMSFDRCEWSTLLSAINRLIPALKTELAQVKRQRDMGAPGELASLACEIADAEMMLKRLLNYGRDRDWIAADKSAAATPIPFPRPDHKM